MGASLNSNGSFEFTDDSPIECDCGCIVEAGEDYYKYSIDVFDTRANEVVKIQFTHCGDLGCLGRMLTENLEGYAIVEECHIDSAEDSADEYADYIYEEKISDALILKGDY